MILLARHGRTSENAAGRILGRRDPPLDRAGRAEAAALAVALDAVPLRALWSSPLLRARQTADVIATRTGLETAVLDELIESQRGSWEGQSVADIARESPELFAAFHAGDPRFAFPGGESLRSQVERTRVALARIAGGPLPALALAHAGTIRAALAIRGRPVPPESALAHGEFFTFDVTGEPDAP